MIAYLFWCKWDDNSAKYDIYFFLRTRMRSSIDDESSVKCVGSDISCVRLNSRVISVMLLFDFFIM